MLETLKQHDHLCLIYESREEWRAAAAPFISIGLKQGEKCIYIVDTSTAEEIRKYLLEEGVDVASAEKSGQLSILHETEAYTREGSFDPDRMIALLISETEKAVSEGYPALRTTGEMTWVLRGHPGSAKLLEYEAKLNRDLFPKYPCLAICQYDRWKFDPEIIKGVIMTHPLLVRGSRIYRNFYYVDPEEFLNKKRAEREVQHWLNNVEREQQMWEELRESEEKYRTLVEQSVQGLVIIQDFRIVFANIVFAEICGYAVEELLSLSPEKVATMIHPEDQALVWGHFRDRLAGKPVPPRYEYRGIRKDGSVIWLEMFASLIEYHGKSAIQGAIIDITKRKRVEETLRESEDRYRDLVEHSHDLLCTHDLEGKLLSVNPAALRIGGYSKNELLGMNFRDFLAPEVRGQFGNYLTEIQAKGAASGVMLVQTKGGEKRLWEYHNTLRTEGVAVPIVRGMARDITERKRAEEALRESEERYRTILDNIEDGYFEVDIAGNFTFFNDSLCRMLGYSRDETMGMNNKQYMDKENAQKVYQTFNQVYTTGEPHISFDWEIIRKDCTKRFIESSVSLIRNSKSEQIGFRGVVRDVTDRKQAEEVLRKSEERFKELYDNAPVGYFEYDAQGRITSVNRTELEILGYTFEEMIGQPVWKFIVEGETARQQILAKLAGTMPPFRGFERTYRRKDGTTFPALIEDRLLRDANGRITGIRCTIQDITERKRAEEEMAALQDQLRQSQKMEAIGRLAGGIAHDFNNLLTVIKGYSQLSLVEIKEGDPLRGDIEEIKNAADRAADLTRQLLAFSRRQIMEMKVLDLNDLLKNLDKMLRRVIGEDIELVTPLAEDLGRVKADPGQIEQVIMNLSVNARDAMPEGGKLTIETANVELDGAYARNHVAVTPGRYVMISVSDTGVGMAPEVRDRVFDPFFTTKEKGKGTGLGLSTVYGIVKQSDGNIWVYSEPGKGATFKIYLPRVDEALEELKERVEVKEVPRGTETILIVEDEEEVLKLAERILSRQGYTVLQTSSTSKALEICKERKDPLHLILTDVVMPQMSGHELIERCRETRQDFKILYMSGYTDNAITHHGILEKGMNYLQKPFTVDSLARKVREALDR
jgi:PAS domain S-box-containing protein